jgi:ubiquinol-cytochrome c reductase iron-sulfur subunit
MTHEIKENLDWSKHKSLKWALLSLLTLIVPASLLPFLRTWLPSSATKLTEAPVRVNISSLLPGQMMTALWQGKPVWIIRRSEAMKQSLQQKAIALKDAYSQHSQQPKSACNEFRSLSEDYFVVLGKCTHLGCVPIVQANQGIICPCHGSRFDFAGRVLAGSPASQNLVVPNYHFSSDGKSIIIGA